MLSSENGSGVPFISLLDFPAHSPLPCGTGRFKEVSWHSISQVLQKI